MAAATPDWFLDALQRWDASGRQSNRGHAYLVSSEEAAEANLFNRVLAAALLCSDAESKEPCGDCKGCRAYRQGAHGDLMILEREEGKRAIGIEQVRSATRFLQQTALYGERKILLVQEADLMTPAAANSLLKTLEEPSGSSLSAALDLGSVAITAYRAVTMPSAALAQSITRECRGMAC